jgi:hypothetical protein
MNKRKNKRNLLAYILICLAAAAVIFVARLEFSDFFNSKPDVLNATSTAAVSRTSLTASIGISIGIGGITIGGAEQDWDISGDSCVVPNDPNDTKQVQHELNDYGDYIKVWYSCQPCSPDGKGNSYMPVSTQVIRPGILCHVESYYNNDIEVTGWKSDAKGVCMMSTLYSDDRATTVVPPLTVYCSAGETCTENVLGCSTKMVEEKISDDFVKNKHAEKIMREDVVDSYKCPDPTRKVISTCKATGDKDLLEKLEPCMQDSSRDIGVYKAQCVVPKTSTPNIVTKFKSLFR